MPGQTTTVLTPLSQPGAQRLPTPQNVVRTPAPSTPNRSSAKSSSSKSRVNASKEKEKKNFSSTLRDDDDINDVAAMGGVNLQEESQRILATNADIVGQQIRSCKDENFLFTTPLYKRINQIGIQLILILTDINHFVPVHSQQTWTRRLFARCGIIGLARCSGETQESGREARSDCRTQTGTD